MTRTVLVTGSQDRAREVSAAVRAAGAQAIEVNDLDALPATLDGRRIDCYVQLPLRTKPHGETVVARLRDFLANGLLERFRAAEIVLPMLPADGGMVFVAGHLPEQASAPDDQQARLALLRVLARAVQADAAPARLHVEVLQHDATPEQIAEVALGGESRQLEAAKAPVAVAAGMRYQDWRAEIIGLAYVES